MTDAAEKLLAEAMKLSPEERERLGQQLLQSKAAANDGVAAAEVFERNDDLSDEQRAHIHGEIIASIRERRAGAPTYDADEVMAELAAPAP